MKRALIILLCSLQINIFAQSPSFEWVKKYGAPIEQDVPRHVDTDLEGNVYVGTTVDEGHTSNSVRVAKYNSSGTLLWSRFYIPDFTYFTCFLRAMDVDSVGNVCILVTVDDGDYDLMILQKYNSSGTKLWIVEEQMASVHVRSQAMTVDKSGNVFVGATLGYNGYTSNPSSDYIVFKYNKNGGKTWGNFYNGSAGGDDDLAAITVDAAGNCYVTGSSMQKDPQTQVVTERTTTIKYSTAGYFTWQRQHSYVGTIQVTPRAIKVDASGYLYVFVMYALSNYSESVAYILKYNTAGNLIWTRNVDTFKNLSVAVELDATGNSYLSGVIDGSGVRNRNIITHKVNSSGTPLWYAQFDGGDSTQDAPSDIAVDKAGNVYVTGGSFFTKPAFPLIERRPKMVTIKYSSLGSQRWVAEYGDPATNVLATGTCLALHGTGSEPLVYVAGNSVTVATGHDEQLEDMLLLKYRPAPLRSLNSTLEPLGSVNPPSLFKLAATPNPFVSNTVIRFDLPYDAKISLKVYDVSGREVRTLINGSRQAGNHQVVFSPVHPVSQQYFYTLQSISAKGEFRETKPLLLSK